MIFEKLSVGSKQFLIVSVLMFLYLFPDIYYLFFVDDGTITSEISSLLISVSIALFTIVLFAGNLRWWGWFSLLIMLVFGIFSFGIILFFKARISINTMGAILNTTKAEASEFMQGYEFITAILLFLFIALVVYLVTQLPKKVNKERVKKFFLTGVICFAVGFSYFITVEKISAKSFFKIKLEKEYFPVYCFKALSTYYRENKRVEKDLLIADNFRFQTQRLDSFPERRIYLLVIGESGRYANWSKNGYSRKTSPNIDTIQNIISFHDVISSQSTTIESVALMMTPAGSENMREHSQQKSILQLFKEAGYKTYYISNQNDWGATAIRIHMEDADSVYVKIGNKGITNAMDGDLIPILANSLNQKKDVFVVLHLTGHHWSYEERYPAAFYKFGTNKIGNKKTGYFDVSQKQDIIDAYDNCTLYQDEIISQLIQLLKKQNCLTTLIYIPDHGENLFDDCRNLTGHGASFSEVCYRVPMFLFYSSEYHEKYPEKVNYLKSNENSPSVSGDDLFYTVADMANLNYSGRDLAKSLASENFNKSKKRMIVLPDDNVVSFDEEVKKEQMEVLRCK